MLENAYDPETGSMLLDLNGLKGLISNINGLQGRQRYPHLGLPTPTERSVAPPSTDHLLEPGAQLCQGKMGSSQRLLWVPTGR